MSTPQAPEKIFKDSRIVGIDFGLARIGMALSDIQKIIAMPFITLKCEKTPLLTAQKLVKELLNHSAANSYRIEEIVIGMPYLMNGKKGILADEVVRFIELLKCETAVPIQIWDERLTSVQAERSLREGTLTRKKRSQHVDVVAATIILQNYLDFREKSIS